MSGIIMRKPLFPLALALVCLVLPALASSARAQTADDIIEKHLAAIGGRAALGKITSRRSTGTIVVSTPMGEISGKVELTAKTPNKSRVYMDLDLSALGAPDNMRMDTKFDGTAGVRLNNLQGDQDITGNQLDNMRNNLFPTALLTYKANGVKMEVLPKAQVNGKDAFVVKATPKAGSATTLYFDAQSYLLVKQVATVNTPDLGDVEQTTELSDFRTVDGIKIPFQVTNSTSQQSAVIKLTKVEHNVAIDDKTFSK